MEPLHLNQLIIQLHFPIQPLLGYVFSPAEHACEYYISVTLIQVLSYSYIYTLNCWLLLNPSWLCFDWSMGCIPLLHSITDYRFIAVISFWFAFATLSIFCFLGRKTRYKRYTMIICLSEVSKRYSLILIGLLRCL